ncbi:helix-turn-helix domain-containing protein [Streptomyces sp. TRM 70361]|uniref:helix-turn-helix domain-containing protein n=1 Tax=Streptomyces sp. TRM 70361 TaxID=3116553 RepID=UPI002E7B319D|nr:helix-turn-helix domain-containing protein [Streptomyces sp. TRM 70361]MEE1939974.1 helix-turn-helix domain-containing protein [Streptomyces sp. TRM 70361]
MRVAVPVKPNATERHRPKKTAYGHKTPHQARQRATVVPLAARGRGNARIAAETRLHVDTVRTWRRRFADGGLPALADRKRTGRTVRPGCGAAGFPMLLPAPLRPTRLRSTLVRRVRFSASPRQCACRARAVSVASLCGGRLVFMRW